MRPRSFLCTPALVFRRCVHKIAALQCTSAVPGYPPLLGVAHSSNVGVTEFSEVRHLSAEVRERRVRWRMLPYEPLHFPLVLVEVHLQPDVTLAGAYPQG